MATEGLDPGSGIDLTPDATARRQAEALAALAAALAALDQFVAGYAFVSTSQAMMVRAMVGTLRGMGGRPVFTGDAPDLTSVQSEASFRM